MLTSYILIVALYIQTGEFGTKGTDDFDAWEYCIKTVDGTDTDMAFCDHKFNPSESFSAEDNFDVEVNDGR